MDTYLKDDERSETVSGIMQPRVMVLGLYLFVFLGAPSLRLRIVVKMFGHVTETMKLCQEFVCPVDRFEYIEKCI